MQRPGQVDGGRPRRRQIVDAPLQLVRKVRVPMLQRLDHAQIQAKRRGHADQGCAAHPQAADCFPGILGAAEANISLLPGQACLVEDDNMTILPANCAQEGGWRPVLSHRLRPVQHQCNISPPIASRACRRAKTEEGDGHAGIRPDSGPQNVNEIVTSVYRSVMVDSCLPGIMKAGGRNR